MAAVSDDHQERFEDTTPLALQVRDLLSASQARLVLAESCTAGQIAASLAKVPGISEYLCGSWVVYRNASKSAWLGIPKELLDDPQIGPVSQPVTHLLATAALNGAPEANCAFAITGDLGPGAPPQTDGTVFCSAAYHPSDAELQPESRILWDTKLLLTTPAPIDQHDLAGRQHRLAEATYRALESLIGFLQDNTKQYSSSHD